MNGHPIPDETANPIAPDVDNAKNWALGVTIAGATMATALSYIFITQFFVDVAGMQLWLAFAFGGFLEVCLVGAGLQARHRILAGADAGVLITLTWVFSGISAGLSASHEIVHRGVDGVPVLDLSSGSPLTMVVRAIAPLVAAVMWHLLLIGEKHMVSGKPRGYRRYARLMHTYMLAREQWRDLGDMDADADTVEAARAVMNTARATVFEKVPVAAYRLLLDERLAAMDADFDGSTRVDRMSEIRKGPGRKSVPRLDSPRRQIAAPIPDSGIPNPATVIEAATGDAATGAATEDGNTPSGLDKEARDLAILDLAERARQGDRKWTEAAIASRVGCSPRTVRNVKAAARDGN